MVGKITEMVTIIAVLQAFRVPFVATMEDSAILVRTVTGGALRRAQRGKLGTAF
jgi:hypothetical protein